jgi:hypothetical protein
MEDISEKLFVTTMSSTKLHPNFKYIAKEKEPYLREVLKGWAQSFIDRDKKFITEFQTTFNSSFWELYLFAVLKKLGLKVNLEFDRPDFVIEGEKGFCIEATIASNAEGTTPEWEKSFSEEEFNEWTVEKVVNNATIRLANAFVSKSQKYLKSYQKLDQTKDRPFVIAIAPFDSPYFFIQNHQPIIRVLYGFDRFIAIDWDGYNRDLFDSVFIEEIDKSNGSKVPLGYFTNPNHSHVSAVIFSNVATASKARVLSNDPRVTIVSYQKYNDYGTQPTIEHKEKSQYKEDLLDGLIVFHNPYADIPFNVEEFYHECIGHYDFDVEKKEFISDIPHGFLYQRQVRVMNAPHFSKNQLKKYRETIIRQLRLGDLVPEVNFPKFHE